MAHSEWSYDPFPSWIETLLRVEDISLRELARRSGPPASAGRLSQIKLRQNPPTENVMQAAASGAGVDPLVFPEYRASQIIEMLDFGGTNDPPERLEAKFKSMLRALIPIEDVVWANEEPDVTVLITNAKTDLVRAFADHDAKEGFTEDGERIRTAILYLLDALASIEGDALE